MNSTEPSVSLTQVLAVCRSRWRWYLTLIAVALLAALIAVLLVPRRYEVKLVALPRGTDRSALLSSLGQLASVAALVGLGNTESAERAEAIQMLQSQTLAREFIREDNLAPVLFASEWDAVRHRWKARERTLNDAVTYFDRNVRDVTEDRRTGLVIVRVTWRDPVQAAAWAKELVRRANDRLRQRAIERAQGAIEYLKRESRAAETVEVQQALYRLMEDQYKTLLLANMSSDYAFAVIDPAVAPDKNQYVFPRPTLFLFGGLFFGVVLVLMVAFFEAAQRAADSPAGRDGR